MSCPRIIQGLQHRAPVTHGRSLVHAWVIADKTMQDTTMPCHATNSDFVGHCHVMPQYRLCRTSHALSAQIIRTKTVSANVTATVLSSLTECVCGGPQYAKPCKDDMSADVKYTNRQGSTPTYEAVHRDMRPRCSIRSTHLLQQARRPAERHVTKVVSEHLGPAPLPSTAPPPTLGLRLPLLPAHVSPHPRADRPHARRRRHRRSSGGTGAPTATAAATAAGGRGGECCEGG